MTTTISDAAKAKRPLDRRRGRLAVLLDSLDSQLASEIEHSILDHVTVGGRRRFTCHPDAIAEVLIERSLYPSDGAPITAAEIYYWRITRIYHSGERRS